MKEKFLKFMRGAVQGKTRVVLSWVLLLPLPFLSQEKLWWPGLVCMTLGFLLRGWASGVIHKDNELAHDGPYALCRNPLYLGSFLIGTGAALTMQSYLYLAMHTIIFALIYGFIIEREEKLLAQQFGQLYAEYCRKIPRFIPGLVDWKNLTSASFQWRQFKKNKGFEAFFTVCGLLVLIELTDSFPWKLVHWLSFK